MVSCIGCGLGVLASLLADHWPLLAVYHFVRSLSGSWSADTPESGLHALVQIDLRQMRWDRWCANCRVEVPDDLRPPVHV